MIAIVDYGMANLRSVEKALQKAGGDAQITSDPQRIAAAERVVLPGVGAFCAAMTNLNASGLRDAVCGAMTSGKPFLGICVGMQMLFENSSEMGLSDGLGTVSGEVVKFFEVRSNPQTVGLKVPHIGWNRLDFPRESALMKGVEPGSRVYFVHSFYPEPADPTLTSATSEYGIDFCCAIERGNIAATQFHPEKSGAVGQIILRNFVNWRP